VRLWLRERERGCAGHPPATPHGRVGAAASADVRRLSAPHPHMQRATASSLASRGEAILMAVRCAARLAANTGSPSWGAGQPQPRSQHSRETGTHSQQQPGAGRVVGFQATSAAHGGQNRQQHHRCRQGARRNEHEAMPERRRRPAAASAHQGRRGGAAVARTSATVSVHGGCCATATAASLLMPAKCSQLRALETC
jgi:hypothetical protein